MIPMTSRTPLAVAASAGACAPALGVAAPAAAAPADEQDKAMVSAFHGIPGMTVDVYANGDELLDGFKPGTVTDPHTRHLRAPFVPERGGYLADLVVTAEPLSG